jgi:trimeric autotransporter adhesin
LLNIHASATPLIQGNFQSGSIGIGLALPEANLHVAGNIWASGSSGHITASGNISASGYLIAQNITASANISASGNIIANQFTGIFNGALSSSAQIASDISGALSLTAIAALGGGYYSSSLQTLTNITSSGTLTINGVIITGTLTQGAASVIATGNYSHAEGFITTAQGDYSHAEGTGTKARGYSSHAEGYGTIASGSYSHAEGYYTTTTGSYSHAEGQSTTARGGASHAEGYGTQAQGAYSHAEGNTTKASGSYSHAEGVSTLAQGSYSHAEGAQTKAEGIGSHAEGYFATASGANSHAEGIGTQAYEDYQLAIGKYNTTGNADQLFIIGKGTSDAVRANAFRVSNTGEVFGAGVSYNSGADYAEYFESLLGDSLSSGTVVELVDDKIKVCEDANNAIGVISATPTVVGNCEDGTSDEWVGKYEKDIWGKTIYEDYTYEVPDYVNENGDMMYKTKTSQRPKLSVNFNSELTYIPRSERPEWNIVGLMGQIKVLKNQQIPSRWIKMKDINNEIALYLVK